MRRFPFRLNIIRRILYRREIEDVHIIRDDDDAPRVLSGRPLDPAASKDEAVDFSTPPMKPIVIQEAFDVAESRLLCNGADRPCTEDLVFTEELLRIVVGFRLIDTAEV